MEQIPRGPQYGYPEPEGGIGTSDQVQYDETYVEYPTSDKYYSYFETSATNAPGMSGGPGLTTVAGASGAAAVQSGVVPSGSSVLAALTPTAITQIEYWLALDGQSPAIQRLYECLIGRQADEAGLAYWSAQMVTYIEEVSEAEGVPYATSFQVFWAFPELAQAFLNIGQPNISNSDLVTLLYEQGFGRAPDPAGFTYWMDKLESGAVTQAQVVGDFLGNAEAIAHSGTWGQQ